MLDRLYDAFKDLRRLSLWSAAVTGGAAFCEVTRSTSSATWHVHLHVIAHARFIPKESLSQAWRAVTGDSFIVDIQKAVGAKASHYVTKYVTKALTGSILHDPVLLDEFVLAMKGRRLMVCFGTWYNAKGDEEITSEHADAEPPRVNGWLTAAPLSDVLRMVGNGDPFWIAVLRQLPLGRWLQSHAPPDSVSSP
jgi:hypothetical protein